MTLDELIELPELDNSHHLRTMLTLPINDRLSFEDHQSEIHHNNLYEFAKTVLDEVHQELKITPPDPEEMILEVTHEASIEGAEGKEAEKAEEEA